jgi:hypothetical protein
LKTSALAVLLALGAAAPGRLEAQEREAAATSRDTVDRPLVRGGRGDRPYLADLAGRLALGGYAEGHLRYVREDGVTEEAGFEAKRFNLFFNSQISDFVRFGAEVEFEDAAREIKLEFMTIDLLLHRSFAVRAGMILLPLGRFNLSHDSPRNPFTDRPFVSTDVLSVALSQPGLGAFGVVPLEGTARFTYELYAVNGFDDGILDAEDGIRLPEGRENFENNNQRVSWSGRVAFSPGADMDFGISGLRGQYNESTSGGEVIDEPRRVTVGALDWDVDAGVVQVSGEAAAANIDIPPSLEGLFATAQWGIYTDVVVPFGADWVATMPRSRFEAKLRVDFVDFDRHLAGDDRFRVSVGVNFRPTADTVFKLDYFHGRSHDRFNNAALNAGILFSAATYF